MTVDLPVYDPAQEPGSLF